MSQKRGLTYVILVFGLALLAMLVMDFNNRMAELRRLTAEKELVSAQVTSRVQTRTALEEQIAYATSEAAVMEWAYQDGNMIRPGDNPIAPLAIDGVTPTPSPTPLVEQEQISNWQRWFSLFFRP